MRLDLSPQGLIFAYATGVFPMADEDGVLHWLAPDPRAILDLDTFQTTRSLRGVVRSGRFRVSVNEAFAEVIDRCADRHGGTWISPEIRQAYVRLHRLGLAHSVEAWAGDSLAGGLYGVSLGGAFFGESMFHRVTDASKVALVYLVEQMKNRGMALLDIQFMTDHLRRFGAVEIPREEYERRLFDALTMTTTFGDDSAPVAFGIEESCAPPR